MERFFFEIILPLSAAGSAAAAALLLLEPLAKGAWSSRWRYYVRLIPLVLFLVPMPFRFPLFGRAMGGPPFAPIPTVLEQAGGFIEIGGQAAETASAGAVHLSGLAAGIWLGGAVLLLGYQVFLWLRFRSQIKKNSRPVTGEMAAVLLAECRAESGVRRDVRLAACTGIGGPLFTGLFHPVIYLPDRAIPEGELRLILLHELTHCQRGDLWYKLVLLAARAIHWFNPVIWLLARQENELCELSCDEALVRSMDQEQRRLYGFTILNQMAEAKYAPPEIASSFSSGMDHMKRRLQLIMTMKKRKTIWTCLSICTAIAVCTAGVIVASALNTKGAPGKTAAGSNKVESRREFILREEPPQQQGPAEPGAEESPPWELTEWPLDKQAEAAQSAVQEAYTYRGNLPAGIIWPVQGEKVYVSCPVWGVWGHSGMDLAAPSGAEIRAAADGVVVHSQEEYYGYGKCLVIGHGDGMYTLYAHCKELLAAEGQAVSQGDLIARVGRTGNATGDHCHFEIRINGLVADPQDYLEPAA